MFDDKKSKEILSVYKRTQNYPYDTYEPGQLASGSYNKYYKLNNKTAERILLATGYNDGGNAFQVGIRFQTKTNEDSKSNYGNPTVSATEMVFREVELSFEAHKIGVGPLVFACGLHEEKLFVFMQAYDTTLFNRMLPKFNNYDKSEVSRLLEENMKRFEDASFLYIDAKTSNIVTYYDLNQVKFIDFDPIFCEIVTNSTIASTTCIGFINRLLLVSFIFCWSDIDTAKSVTHDMRMTMAENFDSVSTSIGLCKTILQFVLKFRKSFKYIENVINVVKNIEQSKPNNSIDQLSETIFYVAASYCTDEAPYGWVLKQPRWDIKTLGNLYDKLKLKTDER